MEHGEAPVADDIPNLSRFGALREAFHDDEIKHAAVALGRTVMNSVITVVDLVPGVGEAVSLTADAGKFTRRFNLTPDVSRIVALGTEGFEFGTAGISPTHAIETTMQIRKDVPRIRAGWQRWKELRT
jgi:hypothetical protein